MKKGLFFAVLLIMAAALFSGCGSSSSDYWDDHSKYEGEYIYTSLDYEYKEYLFVEQDGYFGIGYYSLGADGYYYRTAKLYGNVYNNGKFMSAKKEYEDGKYVTGIYGFFTLKKNDELWINMTEKDPYTERTVTTDTQYFREFWRTMKAGDEKLPEKIAADKTGPTCEKTEK